MGIFCTSRILKIYIMIQMFLDLFFIYIFFVFSCNNKNNKQRTFIYEH
jgi:hypothetical protein